MRIYTFFKSISPKENVIEGLDFKLTYFEALIQHLTDYSTIISEICDKNVWPNHDQRRPCFNKQEMNVSVGFTIPEAITKDNSHNDWL